MKCAAALMVGAAATGCGAAAVGPSGNSASPRPKARELTDAEQILIQRAEQTLVKKCVEEAGFKYWIGRLPTVDELKGTGYVLTDVDWAKRNGYGTRLQEKLQTIQRSDPNNTYARSLSQEERVRYSTALEGGPSSGMLTVELPGGGTVQTPRDSCQVEAKRKLYGDFETWFQTEKTATNLSRVYVPVLLKDQRFVDAVEKWSACMREADHDYASPQEIRKRLPEVTKGMGRDEAFAQEVKLAVAEARCATRTPLSETALALQNEYRAKQPQQYRDAVVTYQHMSLAALQRAEDIVGSSD
ncbi:hypothetical protein GCM10010393_15630 [Streptomyces gobitricini]|uniref:Lipoprotein n=2 Tax=Streptomyces gobitricini TaxID=68211 RepID=A0ABN3LJV6_9ACTN